MSDPNLSEEDAEILQLMRKLSPDGRRAALLAGRALLALSEARKLAEEAVALAQQWGPMIAECMRDDADQLAPPAARKVRNDQLNPPDTARAPVRRVDGLHPGEGAARGGDHSPVDPNATRTDGG